MASNSTFFIEKDDVIKVITEISADSLQWKQIYETKFEWLVFTFGKYQEQSLLLNPNLPEITSLLTDRMLAIVESESEIKFHNVSSLRSIIQS